MMKTFLGLPWSTFLLALLPSSPALAQGSQPFLYKGHDLSSLPTLSQSTSPVFSFYSATSSTPQAMEDILIAGGMNTVRLRLWTSPPYDTRYTVELAKKLYAKGVKIYLDFHFSDTWADPAHQDVPRAWASARTVSELAGRLRTYVNETMVAFQKEGVKIDIVSLGNEIRGGMLWPLGRIQSGRGWTELATLWKAAREGVRDSEAASGGGGGAGGKGPQTMIHIDNGWDTNLQSSWFSSFLGAGVVKPEDFDVFGFSFYPFYGTGATFSNLNRTLWTIADRYKKPIHVAETNWPFTCASTSSRSAPALSEPSIPIGARGQVQWVKRIIDILKAVPGGLGAGIHYWEPGWLNNTSLGSGCGDNILFTADWAGWPDRVKATAREGVGMFS